MNKNRFMDETEFANKVIKDFEDTYVERKLSKKEKESLRNQILHIFFEEIQGK